MTFTDPVYNTVCPGCGNRFKGERGLKAHQSRPYITLACRPVRTPEAQTDPHKVALSPMAWLALRNTVEGREYRSARGLTDAKRVGVLDEQGDVTDLGRAAYAIAYGSKEA